MSCKSNAATFVPLIYPRTAGEPPVLTITSLYGDFDTDALCTINDAETVIYQAMQKNETL